MATRYIIRFDDVVPTMAWTHFRPFEELADQLGIPFLLGVVPDCQDPVLTVEPALDNFWDWLRAKKAAGWTIAQHGHQHLYETMSPGLLEIGKKSEFSGLSYDDQYRKLAEGKSILVREAIWQNVFMAPSHSFDEVTLTALRALNFEFITDGYGFYPYDCHSLTAVPQLASRPLGFGFGVETICLHVNSMNALHISKMIDFIKTNHQKIISFDQASAIKPPFALLSTALNMVTSVALKFHRSQKD